MKCLLVHLTGSENPLFDGTTGRAVFINSSETDNVTITRCLQSGVWKCGAGLNAQAVCSPILYTACGGNIAPLLSYHLVKVTKAEQGTALNGHLYKKPSSSS